MSGFDYRSESVRSFEAALEWEMKTQDCLIRAATCSERHRDQYFASRWQDLWLERAAASRDMVDMLLLNAAHWELRAQS
jgi:hypothetical protein